MFNIVVLNARQLEDTLHPLRIDHIYLDNIVVEVEASRVVNEYSDMIEICIAFIQNESTAERSTTVGGVSNRSTNPNLQQPLQQNLSLYYGLFHHVVLR